MCPVDGPAQIFSVKKSMKWSGLDTERKLYQDVIISPTGIEEVEKKPASMQDKPKVEVAGKSSRPTEKSDCQ